MKPPPAAAQLQDAGSARTSRLIRGIGSSIFARAATSVSPLLLIPLTLDYLGDETYGVWMAVMSVTSMFLWADLGLGNGLLTRLSPLVTYKSWHEGRVVVSTAYATLSLVGALGLSASVLSYWLVPWSSVLNAEPDSQPQAIAALCLAAFAINIPMALVHRTLFALQRVPDSNHVQLMGAVFTLLGAFGGVQLRLPNTVLIGIVVSGPLVANAAASLWIFRVVPKLRPTLAIELSVASELVRSGTKFLAIAVMTSIALNSDNLIVAHMSSIDAVADYSVVMRLFSAMGLLVTVVNLPLWPANADALARGDHAWVRRTTRRMMLLSGGGVACVGVGLLAFGRQLLDALGGDDLSAPVALMLGFASLWTMFAVASPLFMVQNSVGVLSPQLVGWAVFLVLSVPLKIMIAMYVGIQWIPMISFMLYTVSVLPFAYYGYRIALRGPARLKAISVDSKEINDASA